MRKWVKTTNGVKGWSVLWKNCVKAATNEQYKYPRGRADENYTLVMSLRS